MKLLTLVSALVCTAGLFSRADTGTKFAIPDPAAVVDGKEIKASEVDQAVTARLTQMGRPPEEVTDEERIATARVVIDALISRQVIANKAASTPVSEEEVEARYQKFASQFSDPKQIEEQLKASHLTVDKIKEQLRNGIRERKWLDSRFADKLAVNEADAKNFYADHSVLFDAPEKVRVSQIFIAVPKEADVDAAAEKERAIQTAADRIAKGEDFAKVAGEVSEDPASRAKGGDLGFIARTALTPEFTEAAFALQKGQVSQPVKTDDGFHLIKLTDRVQPRRIPFEEAKPKITGYLAQQKRQEAMKGLIADLRAQADIKNNLPLEPRPQAKPQATPQGKPATASKP